MSTRRAKLRTKRRATALIAWLLVGTSMVTSLSLIGAAPAGAEPASIGSFGPVEDWPLIAIHAALDTEGRVVTYGTDQNGTQTGRFIYDVWTPGTSAATGHDTLANTTTTDLFCSLQLNRSDTGDMLLFGGDNWTGARTTNTGNPDINSLSPITGELTTLPGMNRSRWYATGTTLTDGSIYVQGGQEGADRPDHWTPEGGAELLDLDTSGVTYYYPRNFVIPDGRIFGVDVDGRMYYISANLDTLTRVGQLPSSRHGLGTTAVMFEPGKILQFGGPSAGAVIIDVTGSVPIVTPTGSLSSARHWVNATLLPDGRVLASGGSSQDSAASAHDPIETYGVNNTTEIWDPSTGLWSQDATGSLARLYHSTALLLADGRVLLAGGGAPGPLTNTNAELYSPAYLLTSDGDAAARPTIDALSTTELVPGESLDITVGGGPTGIARVTLLKTGSVTHSFNMEQRFVELDHTATPSAISATLPVNGAEVTPGYYLLTVIDDEGIPSESRMVHVSPPSPDKPVAGVDGQVVRLYQAYFLRDADEDGYRYWRGQLLEGLPLAEISDQFAASTEFINRYGDLSDTAFIEKVYGNVLGREPDDEGGAYWLTQIEAGMSRGELMVAFSESQEFIILTNTPPPGGFAPPEGPTDPPAEDPPPEDPPAEDPPAEDPPAEDPPAEDPVDLEGAAGEVYRLYLGYFLRAPDPDGLAYWIGERERGQPLIIISDSFSLSAEFEARYGATTDAGFITLVYANVLEREPDDDGFNYWLQQLDDGMTRGELMAAFTESGEFVAKVAASVGA